MCVNKKEKLLVLEMKRELKVMVEGERVVVVDFWIGGGLVVGVIDEEVSVAVMVMVVLVIWGLGFRA